MALEGANSDSALREIRKERCVASRSARRQMEVAAPKMAHLAHILVRKTLR